MSTIFITGCASGFGRATALLLVESGHRVIATDPSIEAIADLAGPSVLTLELDLSSPPTIRRAVRVALEWSPVDVLINNGGYAIFGTQEEGDLDAIRTMFDVNVFGQAALTQELLPTLRERAGTVVQLSSVAGRSVFPESGWYAATKHSVEALSEALFQECGSFGVKVRLIQPGAFDTNFGATATRLSEPRSSSSPYQDCHGTWDRTKAEVLEAPQDPMLVAKAIVASLSDERPFARIPVGADGHRMMDLVDHLPPDVHARLNGARNGGPALSDADRARVEDTPLGRAHLHRTSPGVE